MNLFLLYAHSLCALGKYAQAVEVIEAHLSEFNDEERLNALFTAFNASVDGGVTVKAKGFARKIAKEMPDEPSIQPYL